MKTKIPLTALVLLLASAIAGAAEKSAEATKTAKSTEAKSADAGDSGKETKKKMIEKGMNGDQIAELFGKPTEIKPMESPEPGTKIEQWIYRRKAREASIQVASGQTMVPTYSGFSGSGSSMTETPVIEYRQKLVVIYQVTALLMINGKLEVAKQWSEQEEKQE